MERDDFEMYTRVLYLFGFCIKVYIWVLRSQVSDLFKFSVSLKGDHPPEGSTSGERG